MRESNNTLQSMSREEYKVLLRFHLLMNDTIIPTYVEWVTVDEDGEFWGFSSKPIISEYPDGRSRSEGEDGFWSLNDKDVGLTLYTHQFRFTINVPEDYWKDSLISLKELFGD